MAAGAYNFFLLPLGCKWRRRAASGPHSRQLTVWLESRTKTLKPKRQSLAASSPAAPEATASGPEGGEQCCATSSLAAQLLGNSCGPGQCGLLIFGRPAQHRHRQSQAEQRRTRTQCFRNTVFPFGPSGRNAHSSQTRWLFAKSKVIEFFAMLRKTITIFLSHNFRCTLLADGHSCALSRSKRPNRSAVLRALACP